MKSQNRVQRPACLIIASGREGVKLAATVDSPMT
jgi:hypothetical protein